MSKPTPREIIDARAERLYGPDHRGTVPPSVPTRPSLRQRLQRWGAGLGRWLLLRELRSQLLSLQYLEAELRDELDTLRAAVATASRPAVATEAARQLRARGVELDDTRGQLLRLRQRLALLETAP
jgi:hypothetical protein